MDVWGCCGGLLCRSVVVVVVGVVSCVWACVVC